MSYRAYVNCNCFKEGKTTEPPYKEFLYIDETGLEIEIPDKISEKNEKQCFKMWDKFEDWKKSACKHEDMRYASEYLTNIMGMMEFRSIVKERGGKNKFPILTKYLPDSNDGTLPAKFAKKALQELLFLENDPEELILLRDITSFPNFKILASVLASSYNIFKTSIDNKYELGIDKNGFFICENLTEKRKEVFRSSYFYIRKLSKNHYKFVDRVTRNMFKCFVILPKIKNSETLVHQLSVYAKENDTEDRYKYIIEPLKKLLKASIKTSNPVVWS